MNGTRPERDQRAETRARSASMDLGPALTALMRYEASTREFRLASATGLSAELLETAGRELVFTLGEERGLVGLVGARRESIYVTNALSEPRWVPFIPTLRSAYFTPLLADDELLGVLILFSVTVDAFSVHERELADMHAHEVARLWRVAGLVDALDEHVSRTCGCDDGRHTGTCSVVMGIKRLTHGETGLPRSAPIAVQNTVDLSDVSPRELEVVGALKRGLRLSQIARSLGISTHTARNHLKRVYRKLGVHSQVELLSLLVGGGGSVGGNTPVETELRVLHVEDSQQDAERVRVALESADPAATVTLATDLAQAKAMLAEPGSPYDLVLTAMALRDGSGLELVAEVRARGLPLPVVVLTAPAPSDQAVGALKAGADDYLVKADDYLERVPSALRAALARFQAESVAARPLRVLYAEDNVADADLAVRHMQRHAAHVHLEVVRCGDEVLQRLPRTAAEPADYDVLLLDYRLPGTDAFDLLKVLRDERKLDTAVVVITGYNDGNVAAQAFRFGATEYLVKHPGHLNALPAVLQGACHRVALARERQALRIQQQALQESEARFRVLFEHVGIGVAQVEVVRGQIIRANQKYCDVFGYTLAEILDSDFTRLLHPEDLSVHQANMEALRSGDLREFAAERRGIRKDGSQVWLSLSVSPMPAAGEQGAHIIVVVKDITDRKLMQSAQQLLATGVGHLTGNAFFHEIALSAAQLLGVEIGFVGKLLPGATPRIRMLSLSVVGCATVGVEYELPGTPCDRVVSRQSGVFPRDVVRMFPTAQLLRTLNVVGYAAVPLTDPNGRIIGVLGVMSRSPLERPDRMETLLRLFAVRTAVELERQRNDAQFYDLFEYLPDAVIIVNPTGLITLANRQAERLFGYSRAELIGMPVEVLIPEADRAEHVEQRRRFRSAEEPRPMGLGNRHLRAQRKDGSILQVDICLSPMRSDDDVLVVAAVRDTSERERIAAERERLEAQLRQVQNLDALGTMAGGMAHDFNNLLTVIVANTEAMRAQLGPGHPVEQELTHLELATLRATELVNSVLTFSRGDGRLLRPVPVRPLIVEAINLLRSSLPHGVQLTAALSIDPGCVRGDSIQLHQAIFNLCTNACQALEGKSGQVEVGLEQVTLQESRVPEPATLPAGSYVHVYVRDTGSGMDAATRERVFEPFFTTKPHGRGTGLGLSVVHGVVKNHGGFVTVDSELGVGSTFHLYLPALPGSASEVCA